MSTDKLISQFRSFNPSLLGGQDNLNAFIDDAVRVVSSSTSLLNAEVSVQIRAIIDAINNNESVLTSNLSRKDEILSLLSSLLSTPTDGSSLGLTSRVPKESALNSSVVDNGDMQDADVVMNGGVSTNDASSRNYFAIDQGSNGPSTTDSSSKLPETPSEKQKASAKKGGEVDQLVFRVIRNDGHRANLIWLTQAKNIFAAQLPKMPREYIARLVFDRKHRTLVGIKGEKVIGGICYRPFVPQQFSEIAFCAVTSSEQVRGYGTKLMNHLKIASKLDGIHYFLTYADNYATGYFKRQGFSKSIELAPINWVGFIKDYDGGTLMECKVHHSVDYLNFKTVLKEQRAAIFDAMEALNRKSIVCNGLFPRPDDAPAAPTTATDTKSQVTPGTALSYDIDIPGVHEAGWTPFLSGEGKFARVPSALAKQLKPYLPAPTSLEHSSEPSLPSIPSNLSHTTSSSHAALSLALELITSQVLEQEEVWPFKVPVDTTIVSNYLSVVSTPMDFGTILSKCKAGAYRSLQEWMTDAALVTSNCRKFNTPDSEYVPCANRIDAFVAGRLRSWPLFIAAANNVVATAAGPNLKSTS